MVNTLIGPGSVGNRKTPAYIGGEGVAYEIADDEYPLIKLNTTYQCTMAGPITENGAKIGGVVPSGKVTGCQPTGGWTAPGLGARLPLCALRPTPKRPACGRMEIGIDECQEHRPLR